MASNTLFKLKSILRLDSEGYMKTLLFGFVLGFNFYLILSFIELPSFIVAGMLTIQINPSMIVIPIVAVFTGPLGGFFVGLIGSLVSDILISHQIVALGAINFAFGLLGLIVGLPAYNSEDGLENGRNLAKFALFILFGWFCLVILYLLSLLVIANQSFEGALLYSFLPFFSISFISLILISPAVARIIEMILFQFNILKEE